MYSERVWRGDRAMNALQLMLRANGFEAAKDGVAILINNATPRELASAIDSIISSPCPNPAELAKVAENKLLERFDEYLPEHLLCEEYAARALDCPGAVLALNAIRSQFVP